MFAKPKRSVGIDLGTHTIKIVELVMNNGLPAVNRAAKIQLDPAQMLSDPTTAQVTGLREGLAEFDATGAVYVAALSGQSVVIRYPRLPMMPDEEIPGAIEIEAAQNIPYEMQEIVMDSVKLEEVTEDGQTMFKILLVAARRELVQGRLSILQEAGIHPHVLGIDSLALTDATALSGALPPDESVALINVGATTTNIHFCRDGMSSFIRDISWGTREINTAIQRAYKLEADGAEQMIELAGHHPTTPPPSDASLVRPPGESPLEPLSEQALGGGAGPLEPLPEQALGGGAGPLEPLPEEISGSEPAGVPPVADDQMMSAVRPAVMRLVGEVRRSFDYYEQQLYERSVKQIILSGGGAEFPLLREIVAEELNVAALQVANPIGDQITVVDEESARDMLDHPAQFVVAVGLAGRGLEWL